MRLYYSVMPRNIGKLEIARKQVPLLMPFNPSDAILLKRSTLLLQVLSPGPRLAAANFPLRFSQFLGFSPH